MARQNPVEEIGGCTFGGNEFREKVIRILERETIEKGKNPQPASSA
jgi:hypothetical protein